MIQRTLVVLCCLLSIAASKSIVTAEGERDGLYPRHSTAADDGDTAKARRRPRLRNEPVKLEASSGYHIGPDGLKRPAIPTPSKRAVSRQTRASVASTAPPSDYHPLRPRHSDQAIDRSPKRNAWHRADLKTLTVIQIGFILVFVVCVIIGVSRAHCRTVDPNAKNELGQRIP